MNCCLTLSLQLENINIKSGKDQKKRRQKKKNMKEDAVLLKPCFVDKTRKGCLKNRCRNKKLKTNEGRVRKDIKSKVMGRRKGLH